MVEALVSTVENTRGVATPSGVPAKEDIVSAIGLGDQDVIYHINGKEVTKEVLAPVLSPKVKGKGPLPGNSRTTLDCASGPAQLERDLSFVFGVYST